MTEEKQTVFDETFNPETFEKYGVANARTFEKKSIQRYAERRAEGGKLTTREGEATYGAGDWIVTDEQGGQYPVHNDKFRKLYQVPEGATSGKFWTNPKRVTLFRTDIELQIKTEWGDYVASVGDYVTLNADGTFGCPIKADAVASGYGLVVE